jgi:hypothetical protein
MYALAFGIGTKNRHDEWLEVYFPRPAFHPDPTLVDNIAAAIGYKGGNTDIELNGNWQTPLLMLDRSRLSRSWFRPPGLPY